MARAILAEHHIINDSLLLAPEYVTTTGPDLPNYFVLIDEGNWIAAAADLERADRDALARSDVNDVRHSLIWPWLAYAWAQNGDTRDAERLIAKTPMDCTLCLEMRGRVAAMARHNTSAAYWFNRAIGNAPSLPFAETDWGELFVRRGNLDNAIAKFASAHKRSPHFADPLEMWGEALIAENRSDLALAKFAEADKYAPNWGRLHLKWGEALWWSGNRDEAKKQFAITASLEMTSFEKSELAKMQHGS
jgi:tetratricopeptide (TPR) repeat protein